MYQRSALATALEDTFAAGTTAPGKRTLTSHLPAPPRPTEPVQRRADPAAAPVAHEDPFSMHLIGAATAGVAGGGGQLPYFDQIQASFGARHDISHIQAHVGGAAAEASEAIGARAYATGSHVAFAGAPDLHTAAHEAAHVVQQRAGVHLAGGVGGVDDVYERHADAVADRVVRGESAADLLDAHAGGATAAGPVVQGKFSLTDRQLQALGSPLGNHYDKLKISDDGKLAVGADKEFFAAPDVAAQAAQALYTNGSQFALETVGLARIPDLHGVFRDVLQLVPARCDDPSSRGATLTGPERCNEMADAVTGMKAAKTLRANAAANYGSVASRSEAVDLAKYLVGYSKHDGTHATPGAAGRAERDAPRPGYKPRMVPTVVVNMSFDSDADRTSVQRHLGNLVLFLVKESALGGLPIKQTSGAPVGDPLRYPLELEIYDDTLMQQVLSEVELIARARFEKIFTEPRENGRDPSAMYADQKATLADLEAVPAKQHAQMMEALGMNEWCDADVGDAYAILPLISGDSDEADGSFPYHWAGVLAKSGHDTVTLENFWRARINDRDLASRMSFFALYGPSTNVVVRGGNLYTASTDRRKRRAGTFHGHWAKQFGGENPYTIVTRRAGGALPANNGLPANAFAPVIGNVPSSSSSSSYTSSTSSSESPPPSPRPVHRPMPTGPRIEVSDSDEEGYDPLGPPERDDAGPAPMGMGMNPMGEAGPRPRFIADILGLRPQQDEQDVLDIRYGRDAAVLESSEELTDEDSGGLVDGDAEESVESDGDRG